MSGAGEPRRRGRPKGSTNKRARDLKGLVDGLYGGSTAQQLAAFCMVTRQELREAGGSMGKAQVAKALELVNHVRRAQEGRDEWLRQVVREELRALADELPDHVREAVGKALPRIREAGSGFSLGDALAMLAKARTDLLPYTDQRQPLAVEAKGAGFAPSVVVQIEGAGGPTMPRDAIDTDFVEVFTAAPGLVSQVKSHVGQQVLDLAEELDARAAD